MSPHPAPRRHGMGRGWSLVPESPTTSPPKRSIQAFEMEESLDDWNDQNGAFYHDDDNERAAEDGTNTSGNHPEDDEGYVIPRSTEPRGLSRSILCFDGRLLRRYVVGFALCCIILVMVVIHSHRTGNHTGATTNVSKSSLFRPINHKFNHNTTYEVLMGKAHRSFSIVDPVQHLGLKDVGPTRPKVSQPSGALRQRSAQQGDSSSTSQQQAYPTNAWYQNLLLRRDGERPTLDHRAYVIPYIIDLAGIVPGVRVHPTYTYAIEKEVHTDFAERYGITIGAMSQSGIDQEVRSWEYQIVQTTPLGVTLDWKTYSMQSSIVAGMPYATMHYKPHPTGTRRPVIASAIALAKAPLADSTTEIPCGTRTESILVHRELELFFAESDYTWIVFVSNPVLVQCSVEKTGETFLIIVNQTLACTETAPFVMRVALWNACTTQLNPNRCSAEKIDYLQGGNSELARYKDLLRRHANVYPGTNTSFSYSIYDETQTMHLLFDWDARVMTENSFSGEGSMELITFALPHHRDILKAATSLDPDDSHCMSSLLGSACILVGSTWTLVDALPNIGFQAPRHPPAEFLGNLSVSLRTDLSFKLPDNYKRGAGDTYFSGKMLARLARILLVAQEILELCKSQSDSNFVKACGSIWLPSDNDMEKTLIELKQSLEIWLNGQAESPFVFDSSWGGLISCGCWFDNGHCKNKFNTGSCPAIHDAGLNFGNGYYNDMHFHYGYFIYAAATIAHFDPQWGRDTFETILLLVRNIANPDDEDRYFTPWRHKDWFRGHSWASGIHDVTPNGRNQESSSEAIASYESVALYGMVMQNAWEEVHASAMIRVSRAIKDAGRVLLASEIRSTQKYWHISRQSTSSVDIYPPAYHPFAIGIMWQTMAQFQTWFGSAPFLAYGIQLLPMTPISEQRDDHKWLKSLYSSLTASCLRDDGCRLSGWRILQLCVLASVGNNKEPALDGVWQIPDETFDDPGGNGHSRTNTIWYIATRPEVIENPVQYDPSTEITVDHVTCGRPDTCTAQVLNHLAEQYTCLQRIEWLMNVQGDSEKDACETVASVEYPVECAGCGTP